MASRVENGRSDGSPPVGIGYMTRLSPGRPQSGQFSADPDRPLHFQHETRILSRNNSQRKALVSYG